MRVALSIALAAIMVTPLTLNALGTVVRNVSATVMSTMIHRGDMSDMALLILWRGAPGWFMGPRNSSSGSGPGDDGVLTGTLSYGGRDLRFTYDSKRGRANIMGTDVPLVGGQNVILVDRVDTPKPVVVDVVAIDATIAKNPPTTLATMFGRSAEVMAFLQCDIVVKDKLGIPWGCMELTGVTPPSLNK